MLVEGNCAKQVIQQTSIFLILFYWVFAIDVFKVLKFDTEKETESTY